MKHQLPTLPYEMDALAPFLSRETLEFHYGKHHRTYVDKLNELIANTQWADSSLEDIIKASYKNQMPVFNNAAQVWNHTFYWNCLKPGGDGKIKGEILGLIKNSFGDEENFQKEFFQKAISVFGSGWTWLAMGSDNKLELINTPNAENPMIMDKKALLTCDIWEHAYYIDYRNERKRYLENFWKIIDWDAVNSRL